MSALTKPKFIVIDVETTGLRPSVDRLHGVGIGTEEDDGTYYCANNIPHDILQLLADPSIAKVGHRVRFDYKFLRAAGIDVQGRLICTKLMAYAVDENASTGLKDLVRKHFGAEFLTDERAMQEAVKALGGRSVADLCLADLSTHPKQFTDIISRYCVEDVNNTWRLFYVLRDKLRQITETQKRLGFSKTVVEYLNTEIFGFEKAIADTELRGVKIDTEFLSSLRDEKKLEADACLTQLNALCSEEIDQFETALYERAVAQRKSARGKAQVERASEKYKTKFSWESGAQVGRLIIDTLGAGHIAPNLVKKTTTGYQTTELVLKTILGSLPEGKLASTLETLLKYKKALKMYATYTGDENTGIFSRLVGGRIFTEYNPFIVTGRLSSVNPNLQNLPRNSPIKNAFVPDTRENVFAYFDYSQVELRIAAHLSQDPTMLEIFHANLDPHRITAGAVFSKREASITDKERQVGKRANFLMIYDGGPRRLAEALAQDGAGLFTEDQCREFIERFWRKFPVLRQYLDNQIAFMQTRCAVVAETGRIRHLPELKIGQWLNRRRRKFEGPREEADRILKTYGKKVGGDLYQAASLAFAHAKKQGLNFPVQSVGASICKRGIIDLHKANYKVTATVHDSVTIELHPSQVKVGVPKIKAILEGAYELSVPLLCDVKILKTFNEKDAA